MPGLSEGVGYVLTGVVSTERQRCFELMRPGDGEKEAEMEPTLSPAVYWRPGVLLI